MLLLWALKKVVAFSKLLSCLQLHTPKVLNYVIMSGLLTYSIFKRPSHPQNGVYKLELKTTKNHS